MNVMCALISTTPDGIGMEEVELEQFTRECATKFLTDNAWNTDGKVDVTVEDEGSHRFILIEHEFEGTYVFSLKR